MVVCPYSHCTSNLIKGFLHDDVPLKRRVSGMLGVSRAARRGRTAAGRLPALPTQLGLLPNFGLGLDYGIGIKLMPVYCLLPSETSLKLSWIWKSIVAAIDKEYFSCECSLASIMLILLRQLRYYVMETREKARTPLV